jgi:electron transfer flavoprotein alpha subunit
MLTVIQFLPFRLKGLSSVIHASSPSYKVPLAEAVSPLLKKLAPEYTHIVSAHSTTSKSLLPRVAAQLDLPALTDVTSVSHSDDGSTTFTRPIYAGNAISTVKAPADVKTKIFTVRSTAFDKAPQDGSPVEAKAVDTVASEESTPEHISTSLTKSDRPDLGVASKVVSGGRALKNAETFKAVLDPLADALGAAVGASRAAVDAGYADNSLQVSWFLIIAYCLLISPFTSGWSNWQSCCSRALCCCRHQWCHPTSCWHERFQTHCCDQQRYET